MTDDLTKKKMPVEDLRPTIPIRYNQIHRSVLESLYETVADKINKPEPTVLDLSNSRFGNKSGKVTSSPNISFDEKGFYIDDDNEPAMAEVLYIPNFGEIIHELDSTDQVTFIEAMVATNADYLILSRGVVMARDGEQPLDFDVATRVLKTELTKKGMFLTEMPLNPLNRLYKITYSNGVNLEEVL